MYIHVVCFLVYVIPSHVTQYSVLCHFFSSCSVLTSSQQQMLACALSLLTSITPHHPPSLLLEQLTYLAQGQSYLDSDERPSPLPPCPAYIPQDLWTHLHSVPLSTAYFNRVITSAHCDKDSKFWAEIEQGKGRSIAEFPWKQGRQEPHSLDDLLLLNLFHEPSVLQVVGRDTATLTSAVRRLSLTELLEGEKRKPLLLLFDESQLACELNLPHLLKELQNVVGVSVHITIDLLVTCV